MNAAYEFLVILVSLKVCQNTFIQHNQRPDIEADLLDLWDPKLAVIDNIKVGNSGLQKLKGYRILHSSNGDQTEK